MLPAFKGGINLPFNKFMSEDVPIKEIAPPDRLIFPMLQHRGLPCEPCVNPGEYVYMGQVIGKADNTTLIHSSVSGRVVAIAKQKYPQYDEKVMSIAIDNDHKDALGFSINHNRNYLDLKPEEIVQIVYDAGIVGLGGVAAPTHLKLIAPGGIKVNTIIANGAESESFLTADNRLMIERAADIISGLKVIMWVFRLREGIIAVNKRYMRAIDALLEQASKEKSVRIKVMPVNTEYPQGGENQLVQAVTGIKVNKHPIDMGAVVFNVETCIAIYRAVKFGTPLFKRTITVSGDCMKRPCNVMVRCGVPVSYVLEGAGGLYAEPYKILMGGPMLGTALPSYDVPVMKNTSAILVLSERFTLPQDNEYPCTRCGRCGDVCPEGLTPALLNSYAKKMDNSKLIRFGINDCIECGCCAYVCPSLQAITKNIAAAKKSIRP